MHPACLKAKEMTLTGIKPGLRGPNQNTPSFSLHPSLKRMKSLV